MIKIMLPSYTAATIAIKTKFGNYYIWNGYFFFFLMIIVYIMK